MTTTTAVPSSDVSDFLFNVQKLDEIATGSALTYTDRLGQQRSTAAGAMSRFAALNPRGAWVTATVYQPRDLVLVSGTWYIALDTHTSGATFAGDLTAHWRPEQGVTAADLASTTYGDSILTHLPGGTGATAESVRSQLRKRIYITNYSSLVVTQTGPLRGVDPATGWLGVSYSDWMLAFRAAFEYADSLGGGEVVLPARTDPYIISDVFYVYSNTTFICEGEIKLGNSTTGGGIAGTADDTVTDVTVLDLKIDGSNIYTGGSGENGWGFGGTNHKLRGGTIKNCARGSGSGDGGKAVQNETEFGGIVVDGLTVRNCFMAASTRQEHILHAYDCGPQIFSNLTAEDCSVLLFVEYAGVGSVPDGKKHSVVLDGFSAKNCGNFEGVMQFSNAGNVQVSNGIVANDGFTTPAFIRGRHRYCNFSNVQFSGDCTSIINNAPGTYCTLTAASEQNSYDIQHTGTIGTAIGSSAASDPAITNSSINLRIDTDPSSGLIDTTVDDTSTHCVITLDDKVLRGTSTFISTYYGTFASVTWAGDVIGNCLATEWAPTITAGAGTITTVSDVVGLATKVGRNVALDLTFTITTNGTGSGTLRISTSTLPVSITPPLQGTTGTFTENTAAGMFGYIYNPGVGGNPLLMAKYDGTYPGVSGGTYSCRITYTTEQ